MDLDWDVFVAAKISNAATAKELQKGKHYEVIAIKGSWYIRDKDLMLNIGYPGSTMTKLGSVEFPTGEGVCKATFDLDRLGEFEQLANGFNWQIEYWEEFNPNSGKPRYRKLAT